MVTKLLMILTIMVPFLLLSCGEKKETPPPESKQTDIEKLETIETSEIPSLYDDDDLLLDEEPLIEDEEPIDLLPTEEPEFQEDIVHQDTKEELVDTIAEPSIDERPSQVKKKEQREAKVAEEPQKTEKVKEKQSGRSEKKIARTIPHTHNNRYEPLFDKKGKYIVSLGSFKQKQNAVNLKNKFKYDGYPVSIAIVKTHKSGGAEQTYYRVNIGNFATKSDAEKFGQHILASKGQKYWINTRK